MFQVATKTIDSATPFVMGNWADPIPSDNPPYMYIPSTDGSGKVLTIDAAGTQTAEPLFAHPEPPDKTQYVQVKAKDGAGLISMEKAGSKTYFAIAGMQ